MKPVCIFYSNSPPFYEKLYIANLLLYCVMNLNTICFTYKLSHVLYLQAFACYVVEVRVMLHECHHVRVIEDFRINFSVVFGAATVVDREHRVT